MYANLGRTCATGLVTAAAAAAIAGVCAVPALVRARFCARRFREWSVIVEQVTRFASVPRLALPAAASRPQVLFPEARLGEGSLFRVVQQIVRYLVHLLVVPHYEAIVLLPHAQSKRFRRQLTPENEIAKMMCSAAAIVVWPCARSSTAPLKVGPITSLSPGATRRPRLPFRDPRLSLAAESSSPPWSLLLSCQSLAARLGSYTRGNLELANAREGTVGSHAS